MKATPCSRIKADCKIEDADPLGGGRMHDRIKLSARKKLDDHVTARSRAHPRPPARDPFRSAARRGPRLRRELARRDRDVADLHGHGRACEQRRHEAEQEGASRTLPVRPRRSPVVAGDALAPRAGRERAQQWAVRETVTHARSTNQFSTRPQAIADSTGRRRSARRMRGSPQDRQ